MSGQYPASGTLAVRYHVQLRDGGVPSGDDARATYTLTLPCQPTDAFGDIKSRLWSKLAAVVPAAVQCPPPADYCFQLANGEMTFEDDDVLSRFLAANEIFREGPAPAAASSSGNKESPVLECVVLDRDIVADRYTRESRPFPAMSGLMQHKGMLQVRVDGTFGPKWVRRFCIIWDLCLFSWPSEQAFHKRDMADVEFLHLGSVTATRLEPATSDRGHNFSFELKKATAPVSQGGAPPPPHTSGSTGGAANQRLVFYAENEASLNEWIACINRLYLRRVKMIVVDIVEELDSRGLESSEGLFRLSANRAHVEALQAEYDAGKAPNLGLIMDEHVLAGCLKNNLRNMPEPLLTYEAYPHILKVGQDYPPSAKSDGPALLRRLDAFKAVLDRLPQTNIGLVEYLMSFLARVADQSAVNRMSAANLAIVFSPNILRPKVENVSSIMADSKNVLHCVEQLITHARDIWVNFTNTRRASRLAFYTGSRPASSAAAAAASGAPSPSSASKSAGRALPPSLPTLSEHPSAPAPSAEAAASSSYTSPSGNRNLPPPGRGAAPPPFLSASSPSSSSSPSAAAAAAAAPGGESTRTAPVGAVRLPYVPVGGVQLMMRKVGPSTPGAPTTPGAATSAAPGPPPLPSSVNQTQNSNAAVTPASAASPPKLPVAAASSAASSSSTSSSAPASYVSKASPAAIAALPEEMLSLEVECESLGEQWVSSLICTRKTMTDAMAQLLDAHANAMAAGKLTSEASSSTAQTVQRCVNVLAADMARWEVEYANLVSFVLEQTKQLPLSASSSGHGVINRLARTSSATKPNRAAIAAPNATMTANKAGPPPLGGVRTFGTGPVAIAPPPPAPAAAASSPPSGPKPPPLPALPSSLPAQAAAVAPPLPPLPAVISPTHASAAPVPPPIPAAAVPVTPASRSDDAEPDVSETPPPPPPSAAGAAASSASADDELSTTGSDSPSQLPLPPPLPRAEPGDTVVAQFLYDGGADSLSLAVGDRLLLLEGDECDTEWWLGRRIGGDDQQEGYFPAAFVTLE